MDFEMRPELKEKNWLVTTLLAWFLGCLGIHRFYTGYVVIGIIQLLTCGGCGIWAIIDCISLALDKYEPAESDNSALTGYIPWVGIIVLLLSIVGLIGIFILLLQLPLIFLPHYN